MEELLPEDRDELAAGHDEEEEVEKELELVEEDQRDKGEDAVLLVSVQQHSSLPVSFCYVKKKFEQC